MGKYSMTKGADRFRDREKQYEQKVQSDPEKVQPMSDEDMLATLLGNSIPVTSEVARLHDTLQYVRDWQNNTGISAKQIKYPSRIFNQSGTLNGLARDTINLFGGNFSKLLRYI